MKHTDDQVEALVERAWGVVPRSPMMDKLMRPVFVDIAIQVLRGDPLDAAFANRMGLTKDLLDHIVWKMSK